MWTEVTHAARPLLAGLSQTYRTPYYVYIPWTHARIVYNRSTVWAPFILRKNSDLLPLPFFINSGGQGMAHVTPTPSP